MKQKVAQDRFYGPDATPHDLGDNPLRSAFNYTLQNGQRTKLEETFTFDHDNNPATDDIAQTTIYKWAYDANDRLLSETIDHHDDALDRTESFVMDLFGNRTNRTIDYVDPAATAQAFAYTYDANDRLISETLDNDNNGSVDQTTTYNWDGTQQTAKEVFTGSSTNPADIISSQSFSYDLQGRLAEVITSPETGPATKVTYSYDSSGIRVSSSQFTDDNANGAFEPSELDHTVSYLVDHRNHTGYAQTIAETTTDVSGNNVKRVTYIFGTDELGQTTYTPDPADADAWLAQAMYFFGHDAHSSVRVLLDALGEIAQSFTYSAYGEVLAIQDATGNSVGTLGAADTSAALTNLLYSGEFFDSNIGQQYLRARWYNAKAARFSRLDPFFGNLSDPLSFNKYNYVHSNPIAGVDPTGKFLVGALSGFAISARIRRADAKASFSVGKVILGAAIDYFLVSATQKLLAGLSLSAKPIRSLTEEEFRVLKYLHENANHKYSNTNVSSELRKVRIYDGTQLGIGDYMSVWGTFAKRAIDGGSAGAITLREKIFFSSSYNVRKQWAPRAFGGPSIALLAHETTHTLQAAESTGGLYGFGPYYLHETAPLVGWGYHESIPEIEGYAMQYAVDDLLKMYPNLVAGIKNGNAPQLAATDLARLYNQHETKLRSTYGR